MTRRGALITRRSALTGLAATLTAAAPAKTLRLNHQFAGGTADSGDFRDRLARRFAAALASATGGALTCDIFPESALAQPQDQLAALAAGRIDLAIFALADAAAQVPALDIALMPGLVGGYAAAAQWQATPIGRGLAALLARQGVLILCWVWQALGVAAAPRLVRAPEDARGLRLRGGGTALDDMLARAGARPAGLAAQESYAALQAGRLDGCVLSSTAMIAGRLEEVARNVTAPADVFGMALCPLVISLEVFAALPPDRQAALRDAGSALEPWAMAQAQADDAALAAIYLAAAAPVQEVTPGDRLLWRPLADAAQAAYARRSQECAALLALAK